MWCCVDAIRVPGSSDCTNTRSADTKLDVVTIGRYSTTMWRALNKQAVLCGDVLVPFCEYGTAQRVAGNAQRECE